MTFAEIAPAHVAEGRAVGPRCERDDRVMARIAASRGELGCPEDELPRALVDSPGRAESDGRVGSPTTLGMGRCGDGEPHLEWHP